MATHKSMLLSWAKTSEHASTSARAIRKRTPLTVIAESAFVEMLRFERRRTERSGRQFMLVLLKSKDFRGKGAAPFLSGVVGAVSAATRETDVLGWYEQDATLGLLMTEIGLADKATTEVIVKKISEVLRKAMSPESFKRLSLVFRIFPQEIEKESTRKRHFTVYPDLAKSQSPGKHTHLLKQSMDVLGSLIALIVFAPAILVISVLIKLTSRGPVLFCQKRVGQYGKEFCFLKFRTMYVNNDPAIHREYTARLIEGKADVEEGKGIYKLVNDPRITPLGRFLRRTSLDELPQFINILRCEMSLVGPRPPLPYEYERYQTWHRRRVLELKPGLTGLWQVYGRSRTSFNEMVRMDLNYADMRSFWFDCKILLKTPAAMISGRGAC